MSTEPYFWLLAANIDTIALIVEQFPIFPYLKKVTVFEIRSWIKLDLRVTTGQGISKRLIYVNKGSETLEICMLPP